MSNIFFNRIRKMSRVFLVIFFGSVMLIAVVLLYQKHDRHVKGSLAINQSDKPVESVFSGSPDVSKKPNQDIVISVGADDMEMQQFIDDISSYEISEIMDKSVSDSINEKMRKDLELIRSGNHPDYPMPPVREDFLTDMDYYKADLEYYKKEFIESEGTKYQETFGSIISRIEKNISREQNRESDELESRKREKLRQERENYMIQEGSWIAGLMALSEQDREIYLKYIDPNIQDDGSLILPDNVINALINEDISKSSVKSDIHTDKTESMHDVNDIEPITESDFHKRLIKDFPDVFSHSDPKSRDAFLQKLTSKDARQFFYDRQSLLQKEYATLLASQLKGLSKQKREQAIAAARQSLLQKWDADFADAVIRQLQQEK